MCCGYMYACLICIVSGSSFPMRWGINTSVIAFVKLQMIIPWTHSGVE